MFRRISVFFWAAIFGLGTAWLAIAGNEKSAAVGTDKPAAVDTVKAKIAKDVYALMMARWRNNEAFDIEDVETWSRHILDADLDIAASAEERVAAYEEQMKRTTELARIAKSFAQTGQSLESAAMAAEYYRLEAVSLSAKGR